MHQGYLSHLPPILKLVLVLLLVITFGSLSGIAVGAIANPVFGVDIISTTSMQSNVALMQTFQIVQSISLFIIPSLLGFYLFFNTFKDGLQGSGGISVQILILTVGIIILGQGFITFSAWLNHQLTLPGSFHYILEWMMNKEEEAGQLTVLMIRSDNWLQISITVIMLSVLPALGEEWLFRGFLQRELGQFFKNQHIAIIITAIFFSAVHVQFLTFLPRFFLGVILGYLFLYSKNLWVPIMGHFTNNFIAIVAYMVMDKEKNQSPLDIPLDNPFGIGVIISLGVIIFFLYLIKKNSKIEKVKLRN